MRGVLLLLVFAASQALLPRPVRDPYADDSSLTAAIDCSSASVDFGAGESVTKTRCQSACKEICSSVTTQSELESCLQSKEIEGCLFKVSSVYQVEIDECLHYNNDVRSVVAQVEGEDLTRLGTGEHVSGVSLVLRISNPDSFSACSNRKVKVGISSLAYDEKICRHSGSSTLSASYAISKSLLTIPVFDVFKGSFGTNRAITFFIEFEDSTCGDLAIMAADVYFSMSYDAGYIDQQKCWETKDCQKCLSNECHWCDWNKVVNSVLPEWLPDWDWIENLREKNKGQCGLNSAMCSLSIGNYDVCGASSSIWMSAFAVVTALLLLY